MVRALLVERQDELSEWPQQVTRQLVRNKNPLFNRHRLALMLELYTSGAAEFLQLRHDLNLNDGALMTHLKALKRAGWIDGKKEEKGKLAERRRTTYTITSKGMHGMIDFFDRLREIDARIIRKE
jgi:DNA-binding PadR family transcriptional regulator